MNDFFNLLTYFADEIEQGRVARLCLTVTLRLYMPPLATRTSRTLPGPPLSVIVVPWKTTYYVFRCSLSFSSSEACRVALLLPLIPIYNVHIEKGYAKNTLGQSWRSFNMAGGKVL